MGKLEWSREARKASWTGSLARTPERGTMCVGRCRHKELGECEIVCALGIRRLTGQGDGRGVLLGRLGIGV